jgi:hypothetical protein
LKAIEVHGLPAAPGGMRPGPDDMLTMTELAARLKLAMRTMERWHRKGVVLGIRVEDVILFYWPAVVSRLLEKYQEREKEPRAKTESPSPPVCAKVPAPPPVKLPISKVTTTALRTVPPALAAAGRSVMATAKRPQ